MKQHFQLMATYNRRMNRAIYDACEKVSAEEITADRGAFFGSIIGTLNHIVVGDIVWLKRFFTHPQGFETLQFTHALEQPATLSELVETNLPKLNTIRQNLDARIIEFTDEATESHYHTPLSYKNMAGDPFRKPFGALVQHFFNHQTHHRGQVSTLLSQRGVDIGVTDLLDDIPDITGGE